MFIPIRKFSAHEKKTTIEQEEEKEEEEEGVKVKTRQGGEIGRVGEGARKTGGRRVIGRS